MFLLRAFPLLVLNFYTVDRYFLCILSLCCKSGLPLPCSALSQPLSCRDVEEPLERGNRFDARFIMDLVLDWTMTM